MVVFDRWSLWRHARNRSFQVTFGLRAIERSVTARSLASTGRIFWNHPPEKSRLVLWIPPVIAFSLCETTLTWQWWCVFIKMSQAVNSPQPTLYIFHLWRPHTKSDMLQDTVKFAKELRQQNMNKIDNLIQKGSHRRCSVTYDPCCVLPFINVLA